MLITGAAGNLGGLLAHHLAAAHIPLKLMVHRTPLEQGLRDMANVTEVRADLSRPETLPEANVRRVVLISFPHVEGATTVSSPATGRLDGAPESVHARTRLEEERLLFDRANGTDTSPVVLRLGMVYHIGDEDPVTLQHFLDEACRMWELPRPRRLPFGLIHKAAYLCEMFALLTGRASPLTRDFVTIGRASYFGDTQRARAELIPHLRYPTLEDGVETLA